MLSYQQWQAIRQAEDQREASRVALREKKEQDRATYSVARGGRPLPGIDPAVERALGPFVAACAAAVAQLQQRVPQAIPLSSLPPVDSSTAVPSTAVPEQQAGDDRLPPLRPREEQT